MLHLPVLLALLAAWMPPEVLPWTAPALAALALAVVLGAPDLPRPPRHWGRGLGASGLLVVLSAVLGLDRGAALTFIGLMLLGLAAGWAGRTWGTGQDRRAIAWGLAALSVWALIQALWTFAAAETVAAGLPEGLRDPVLYRLGTRRAVAGLAVPGHLAVVLVMGLALALDGPSTERRRRFWWGPAVLALAGIAATRSLVGAALAVVVVLVMAPPRVRRWLLPAALAAGVAVAFSRPDLASMTPLVQRLDNWRTALWIWTHSPWLGAGPGAYRQAAQAVPFPVSSVSAYAHSLPLQALAELGPAGLAAVLLGYGWVLRLVLRHWNTRRGLAVAVAAGALHNLVDFSLLVGGVLAPWAVLLGMLSRPSEPEAPSRPPRRLLRRGLAAAALLAVVLAGLNSASRSLVGPVGSGSDAGRASLAVALAPWRIPPRLALASEALRGSGGRPLVEAAVREVQVGLFIAPRSAALELAAARLAIVMGDPSAALVHCRRSLADRPDWPPARELERDLLHLLEGGR